ncbi:hypothetical protein [Microbulbifer mangrovi]|uniref:hypothetical protein n=1 Tax=Microbulbifer mangrovi TaxID=927787 RepID=UPI00117F6008|nr:hypothetical protein [Microbulbifer mangrovi]
MPVWPVSPGIDPLSARLHDGWKLLVCLLLTGCLTACNFDSDSDNRALGNPNTSRSSSSSSSSGGTGHSQGSGAELTGVFAAGGVKGLRFRTESFSGLTDSDGTFRYRDGETVEFSLGGIVLGSAVGAPQLTPFDLVGASPYTSEVDLRVALGNHQWVDPLDQVSNMMRLLLILDRDQDPDTGIDLSDWDADLADDQLDLDYDLYAFPYRRGLDSLPAITSRFSIKYQLPLEFPLIYLYDALGIVVPVHVPVRETRDVGDNDTVEQEVLWVYNDLGLPLELRLTFVPDDEDSWRERLSYEYDTLGRRVLALRETDTDEDANVEFFYRSERFYSNRGFLVEVVEEDGQLQVSERRVYRFDYDDGGNRIVSVFELDDDVDGALDSVYRVERLFSDDGLLDWWLDEADLNADGRIERRRRFAFRYNSNGQLLEQVDTLDNGDLSPADGVVDVRIEVGYRYGGKDRLLRETQRIDDNGDGVVDRENTFEYAYLSDGRLRRQIWEYDVNADGVVNTRRTFEYRYLSSGELIEEEMTLDNNADGIAEAREVTEYRYNSRGQLRQTEIAVYNGADDLQSLLTISREYGSHGQLLSWYREGEGFTGTTNTPIRLRWRYLEIADGLRYLIDHYRYREPAYSEIGVTDLNEPCEEYRFAEDGPVCALSWPMRWQLLWAETWLAPGLNLGGPVVVRP